MDKQGIFRNRKAILQGIFLTSIVLIGYLIMIWITPFASGISPDSTVYIGGAQSLLTGKGFSINDNPITQYPPFYSLLLAGAGSVQSNFAQAARHLNSIIFGINAGIISLAVYLTTKRNVAATTCAALFFLSSAPLLELHSWAWSEPLFITLSLTCIILLSKYIVQPNSLFLATASLSLALAITTRYIGLAFLPPAFILVFIAAREKNIWKRLGTTLSWSILTITLPGIWFSRNILAGGTATSRLFAHHPTSVNDFGYRIYSLIISFFIPVALPAGIRPLIAIIFIIAFIYLLALLTRRLQGFAGWYQMESVLPVSCFLFIGFFILFLFLSITFFDASTPVDWRIFSPVFAILIMGLFSSAQAISQAFGKPVVMFRIFLLIICLSIALKTPFAIQSALSIQKNGLGYTSRQWQESESIAFIRSLPNDTSIYSNGNDVIKFLTGKQVLSIPSKINSITSSENSNFYNEIDFMCQNIKEHNSLLIYLNNITWRWYLPNQAEVEEFCQLPILNQFDDGTVYGKN